MGIIAAIMCGGKGTRMDLSEGQEKPMLRLRGTAMVELVYRALTGSNKFERIVAAVSPNTPETKKLLVRLGAEIFETKGDSYSKDLSAMLSCLKPSRVFVTSADLPLLDPEIIGRIISMAVGSKNNNNAIRSPAISIVAEKSFQEKLGSATSVIVEMDGKSYSHSGVTVFDTLAISGTSEVEEEYVVMNEKEVALNVNTRKELELAEKLLPA